MHFLLPSDPLNARRTDELFADQAQSLRSAGFSTSLLPEGALEDGSPLRGIPADTPVVYRGWMLRPEGYQRLAEAVTAAGGQPLTTPQQYRSAHYLPEWYPLLQDLTPETHVYPAEADLAGALRTLGWGSFFIKDYVKSLKTGRGAILHAPEEITELLAEMRRFRGEIEGGVCVRRVEQWVPDSEQRYFVILGQPYASEPDAAVPSVVHACAERLSSPFFSVDVAAAPDGTHRVVEVGDGQVSDLVGWTPERFAETWRLAVPASSP